MRVIFTEHKVPLIIAFLVLIATAVAALSLGSIIQTIIDKGVVTQSTQALHFWMAIFVSVSVLFAVASSVRYYLIGYLNERITTDLRKRVFAHLLTLPPSTFLMRSPGDIASRITNDTTVLQAAVGLFLSIFMRNFVLLIGSIIWLFVLNVKLACIALASIPILLFPMFMIIKKVRMLSKNTQERVAGAGAMVMETLQQLKNVQAYEKTNTVAHNFNTAVEGAFELSLQRIKMRAALVFMAITFTLCAIMLLLWVGGMDVIDGNLSNGELAAFVFYAIIMAISFSGVSEVIGELPRAIGAFDRITEILSWPSMHSTGLELPSQNQGMAIEIKNVCFRYPDRTENSLQNICLHIQSGEKITLIGRAGSGKSTLVDMIMGFYPYEGQILIDGIPQTNLDHRYRQQIAYVSQEIMLTSGTIVNNIAYGADITLEQVKTAAKKAGISEFIERLPKGYDTHIGPDGLRLSGGQRQRLVIARALLRNPRLLILDEPTAHLDPIASRNFLKSLKDIFAHTTIIIIAHHLETIRQATHIVMLDNGQIMAEGTPASLIDNIHYQSFMDDVVVS